MILEYIILIIAIFLFFANILILAVNFAFLQNISDVRYDFTDIQISF